MTPPEGRPAVVLVEPQLGENIGVAARAMANFSLNELILVAPRDRWPNEMALRAASGAPGVLEGTCVHPTLEAALAGFHFVVATTARRRDMIKPIFSPRGAAQEMRRRIGRGERVAVMFGGERAGLDNDAVALADALVMAPVNPAFASLNLGQAVLLVAYEWYLSGSDGSLGRETTMEPAAREGLDLNHTLPASKADYIGLFDHLERVLDEVRFFHPPDKRPTMVRSLRNLLQRQNLTEQDVRTLRGVIVALAGEGRFALRHPRGKAE